MMINETNLITDFSSLGLCPPLLRVIEEKGYLIPTPLQVQTIPAVLSGRDIMAAARTGTGKTAAFVLPVLQKLMKGDEAEPNHVRALIVTPTRELAVLVEESVSVYGKYLNLTSALAQGGVSINEQKKTLKRGIDILVATPARLLELYGQSSVKFSQLEFLVLAETDRMLEMGFIQDLHRIYSLLPKDRQSMLFTSSFSKEIRTMGKGLLNNPAEISAIVEIHETVHVEQWIYPVDKSRKTDLLTKLVQEYKEIKILVFCNTKHSANRLTQHFIDKGISTVVIHEAKSHTSRMRALSGFIDGDTAILVTTDPAVRELNLNNLPLVVSFELPKEKKDYINRISHTGNTDKQGKAFCLVCLEELQELKDIERLTKQILPRRIIRGYEPHQTVPETKLDDHTYRGKKTRKAKAINQQKKDG